jgi:hypothetical protein
VVDDNELERRQEDRRHGERREGERRRNWDRSAYERLDEWQRRWNERQDPAASSPASDPDAKT